MTELRKSPEIVSISWGQMEVATVGRGKDFKLWPGGGREWDWNETGMHHSPGITPAELSELVENGAKTIVLSRGILRRLEVTDDAKSYLDELGLAFHVKPTKDAVRIYNELADRGEPVGGLFHSTC